MMHQQTGVVAVVASTNPISFCNPIAMKIILIRVYIVTVSYLNTC